MTNLNMDLLAQLGLAAPGAATASAAPLAAHAGAGTISSTLSQSDFLKLMTTQLTNQDPTNPLDNNQMLAQMAQMASVSGIQDMQNSITKLVDTLSTGQTLQAAALVGHQVIAAGANAQLDSSGKLMGAIDVPQGTNDLTVGVYDGAGQLVRKIDLGAQSQGLLPFTWDGVTDQGGNAPSGIYSLRAVANVNGTQQSANTYVASTVDSVVVDKASGQLLLNTSGGESIKMGDVQQIM